jgi:hypothetical protein
MRLFVIHESPPGLRIAVQIDSLYRFRSAGSLTVSLYDGDRGNGEA